MSAPTLPSTPSSDAAVASAMRCLEADISAIVNMSLIASLSLDEMLNVQNREDLNQEERRLVLYRSEIDRQEWAATHVWELAKRLREKYEAAWRGEVLT